MILRRRTAIFKGLLRPFSFSLTLTFPLTICRIYFDVSPDSPFGLVLDPSFLLTILLGNKYAVVGCLSALQTAFEPAIRRAVLAAQ